MNGRLNEILALTDAVQQAIDAGEWQRAHDVDVERRALLEALALEQGDAAALGAALANVQARTYVLIGQVEHHKRRVLREATTVKTAHTAVAAYTEAEFSR